MTGIVEAGVAYAILLGLIFYFSKDLLNEIASLEAELGTLVSPPEDE